MPNPSVLQFGTSRFLQAHADLFFAESMPDARPVTVVQTSGDARRAARLAALAEGYQVRIRGLVNGVPTDTVQEVSSIRRGLSFDADMAEVQDLAQRVDIILSNTGDTGFSPTPADTKPDLCPKMSYPAKLAHLLHRRFRAGARPVQIMPTELIRNNGTQLRRLVCQAATDMGKEYHDWLCHEVVWVNSLVDRIVSQPLYPAGAVAEPYALWAIQDQARLTAPCIHPAVQVVPDLGVIERRKLFVLNLGHSLMASEWLEKGRFGPVHVRDVMQDADWAARLRALYEDEVRPAFVLAGEAEGLDDYIETTLERFANPYLDHRLEDIAQNHAEKLDRRIGAFLSWAQAHGDSGPKPKLRAALQGQIG